MDTILHLLSPAYLFNRNLGPYQSDLAYVFVGINIVLIIIAIISRRLAKKRDLFAQKAAHKFGSLAWTMGAIGIILYVFRQINVFYLSAPAFVLIWLIITGIWLILVLKYWLRTAPKRRKQVSGSTVKDEYMP
ncbi:hypothetical protein CL632_02890 [bacterium]|jgi:hypothetical protein|nr:hypothetical protein [bacterium]MDP6571378.1 hypothetical protein [Patescibacteria group bacterium]MDP6756490.1 hypothetical protein [Patescibacteria group bacterium]|tara:strand:+ start:12900 stop:13298 length:399 start_codon:yes stop_codon:yes gene_type:complete